VTTITGTLHEDVCTFMIISCWILLRMGNVSDRSYRENQNTHFTFINFFPKVVPFMRYRGKIYDRHRQTTDDNKIRRMRIVCRINKITNIHSCYTYCFSTATMVTRTRLSVTFIRTLPLLFWGRLSVRYEEPSNKFWTQSTCTSTANPD